MFPRDLSSKLEKWAVAGGRKPLVIRGARQVGKTVTVKMFGERFESFIYLNLDVPGESDIFQRKLPIQDTFQAILLKSKPLRSRERRYFSLTRFRIVLKPLKVFATSMKSCPMSTLSQPVPCLKLLSMTNTSVFRWAVFSSISSILCASGNSSQP